MRVLICPDKFAGTADAVRVAESLATGWRDVAPDDELELRPLSDGGPGFVDVLATSVAGRRLPVPTTDPLGRPVPGEVLLVPGGPAGVTAYVESAQACGLHLLAPTERDPLRTTSYGLGVLLFAAVEAGAGRLVVGLGGSATNDCGAGMLAALGVSTLDGDGRAVGYGGAALLAAAALDGLPALRGATVIGAADVDNPLTGPYGASAVFGPQKGAGPDEVTMLDAALARFARIVERDLPGCPPGLADLAGAGAAGGLGAAVLALGGSIESGLDLIRAQTGLDGAIARADLVITGEGSFDSQSLRGKVVSGVGAAARAAGVRCVVVAGRSDVDGGEAAMAGIDEVRTLVERMGSVAEAMRRPEDGLRRIGADLAHEIRV